MREALDGLTDAQAYGFAADCIDRVVANYAKLRPGKIEATAAVTALRGYAAGTGTSAQMTEKKELAEAEALATDEAVKELADQGAVFALSACVAVYYYDTPKTRTDRLEACMRKCARSYAFDHATGDEPREADYETEMTWQQNTLAALT